MEATRIQTIIEAATRLFIRQGYARTQITDIAQASDIAVGTVYRYFAGKREILHCLLRSTIDPSFSPADLPTPITDDHFTDLTERIRRTFIDSAHSFGERAAAAPTKPGFHDLIGEAFDIMWEYAPGCLFIEKNVKDCEGLIDPYVRYRGEFVAHLDGYLARSIETHSVRPLNDRELSTRMIVEILAWWTMDMRFDSVDSPKIPKDRAKSICLETIEAAYLA